MKTTTSIPAMRNSLSEAHVARDSVLTLLFAFVVLLADSPATAADFGGFLKDLAREAAQRAANEVAKSADEARKKSVQKNEAKKSAPATPTPVPNETMQASTSSNPAIASTQSIDRASLSKVVYTTVALSDMFNYSPSSPRPGKVIFPGFPATPPVINNNGVVAFKADSSPDGGVDGDALLLGTAGNLQLISRQGTPLPGIEGRPGHGLHSMLQLDSANNLVLCVGGTREGSGPTRFHPTLWQSSTGKPIFSQEDSEFTVVDFRMADGGRMCGNASVDNPDKEPRLPGKAATPRRLRAVWVWKAGRLTIIAKQGEPAPGLAAGMRLHAAPAAKHYQAPLLNQRGDVLFEFEVEGPGVNRENCLWLYREGKVELLARQGEKAPGLDEPFGSFLVSDAALNASGQVAFMAGRGIWVGEPGRLQLLVKHGDPRPGSTLPNSVSLHEKRPPALLDDGRVVFEWSGRGEIWAAKPGSSELVFRPLDFDGDRASAIGIRELAVRAGGMMACSTDFGLWAGEPGNFHRVACVGQEIEVAPGDVRKVSKVGWLEEDLSGPATPRRSYLDRLTGLPFNDRGQILLHLTFERVRDLRDKTEGILIATLPLRPAAAPFRASADDNAAVPRTDAIPTESSAPARNASVGTGLPAGSTDSAPAQISEPTAHSALASLPSPWRPDEKRSWGRPVLLKETPVDVSKLAWPKPEAALVTTYWTPVSSNRWGKALVCFSDDLRHVAYVAQKAIGQTALVKDGLQGPIFDRILEDVRLSADFGHAAYIGERSGKRFLVHVTPQGEKVYEWLNGAAPTYLPKTKELKPSEDLQHVFSLITLANPESPNPLRPGTIDFIEIDGVRQSSPIRCDPREIRFPMGHVVEKGPKGEKIVDGKVVGDGNTQIYWSPDGSRMISTLRRQVGGVNKLEVRLDGRVLGIHENAESLFSLVFSPDQRSVAYKVISRTAFEARNLVIRDGQVIGSYPPAHSVGQVCFSPDGQGIAYPVKASSQPDRVVVVANGHEGPLTETESQDLNRGMDIAYGPTSRDIAYLLCSRAEWRLVVNGAVSGAALGGGISMLKFTADAAHVVGMGRKCVMADGTTLAIKADRLWDLQVEGADRFSAFACRGENRQGVPEQFLKLEFQIVPTGSETSGNPVSQTSL